MKASPEVEISAVFLNLRRIFQRVRRRLRISELFLLANERQATGDRVYVRIPVPVFMRIWRQAAHSVGTCQWWFLKLRRLAS